MSQHVFTYGSLMFSPVWQQVVRGTYRSERAWLDGYSRHALRDDTYPGMVEAAGSRVEGRVYFDVDQADLARLDRFEGDEYRRIAVRLRLGSDGRQVDAHDPVTAHAYLFTALNRLAPQPWDPAAFALERFMASYVRDKLG